MDRKTKWIAVALIAVALIIFSQSAGADMCWYTEEGVPCKESL